MSLCSREDLLSRGDLRKSSMFHRNKSSSRAYITMRLRTLERALWPLEIWHHHTQRAVFGPGLPSLSERCNLWPKYHLRQLSRRRTHHSLNSQGQDPGLAARAHGQAQATTRMARCVNCPAQPVATGQARVKMRMAPGLVQLRTSHHCQPLTAHQRVSPQGYRRCGSLRTRRHLLAHR